MGTSSITTALNANQVSARSCDTSRTGVRFTEAVMQKAQTLFQTKIAIEIAARAKCGIRTAEYWKAGEREIGVAEYLMLLEGEDGVAFLEVLWEFVPDITRQRWLKKELLAQRLHKAELKQAQDRREIEQLRLQLSSR